MPKKQTLKGFPASSGKDPVTKKKAVRVSLMMGEELFNLMNKARFLSGRSTQEMLVAGLERVVEEHEK